MTDEHTDETPMTTVAVDALAVWAAMPEDETLIAVSCAIVESLTDGRAQVRDVLSRVSADNDFPVAEVMLGIEALKQEGRLIELDGDSGTLVPVLR